MNTKTKILNLIVACTAGTIFFLAIAETLFLAIGDTFAGVLTGRAETGWGILIALFLFLPIAIVAFLVFRTSIKKYKATANKPIWILWVISLLLAIGIAATWTLLDQPGPPQLPPESAQDISTRQELEKAKSQVETYYYKNKGTLPDESALSTPLDTAVTYKIINQNTYELCGNFTSDSISPLYKQGSAKNGTVYQKVVEGSALDDIEAIGIFRFHSASQQCYKLGLSVPTN